MENIVNTLTSLLTVTELTDVALNEVELAPLREADEVLHFIQIALMASSKIVKTNHMLVEFQ